ncbi:hypothetical protein FCV20_17260 [Clostridium botulinum]|nr:hypothetical protein VT72_06910 [Clostridium botulinum]NEZ53348.1 hypothetical protein [Clostridium botulinum F str. Langeland]NFF59297.1 hypothetical protein [Clostridium botulinum]NFL13336.1 hypothetical protein [Clostridium botulinum]NFL16600.1 hypothetical protein [Clostridium botulinum]
MVELLNMKNIKKSFSDVQVLHEINNWGILSPNLLIT